jgi:hypothetical protein
VFFNDIKFKNSARELIDSKAGVILKPSFFASANNFQVVTVPNFVL